MLDVAASPDAVDLFKEPGDQLEHALGEEETVPGIGARSRHGKPSPRPAARRAPRRRMPRG